MTRLEMTDSDGIMFDMRCHKIWSYEEFISKRFIVISGPSAGGKSTVMSLLHTQILDSDVVVKYTDRNPRKSEVNAIDYHFVSSAWFNEMGRTGRWLSYEKYYGNQYVVSRDSINSCLNRICIVIFSPPSALIFRQAYLKSILVFVAPSSLEIIFDRLNSRSLNLQEIERRRAMLQKELQYSSDYDYQIDTSFDPESQVSSFVEQVRSRLLV